MARRVVSPARSVSKAPAPAAKPLAKARKPRAAGAAKKPRVTMDTPCKKAGQVRYVTKKGQIRCKAAPTGGKRTPNPALASAPCKRVGYVRQQTAPFRCLKEGGRTHQIRAADAGVCLDKVKARRDGKTATVHYVSNPNFGKVAGARRCLKAGGKTAKATLGGAKACAPTQVLKTYTKKMLAIPGKAESGMVTRTYTRCVKAQGAAKACPVNKVLATKTVKGKLQHRCVTEKALEARTTKKGKSVGGWTAVARGTLPVAPFKKTTSVGGAQRRTVRGFRMQKNALRYAAAVPGYSPKSPEELRAMVAAAKARRAGAKKKRAAPKKQPAKKRAASQSPKRSPAAPKRARKPPTRLTYA